MFNFIEIVGTKDYIKPDWVSHMEELQEVLQGMYKNIELTLFDFRFKSIYTICKCYKYLRVSKYWLSITHRYVFRRILFN